LCIRPGDLLQALHSRSVHTHSAQAPRQASA
jgi:hypothetical protein